MKKIIIIAVFLCSCTYKSEESISLAEVSNTKRLKEVAKEFLSDIGGEEIVINESVRGYYFNPKNFQKKEIGAYKKWRMLFSKPKNCKLTEMFQINYQGTSLLELFSLPKTHAVKKDSVAALCFPSFSLPFEFDPKWILSYLSKGVHVLAVNYENNEKTLSNEWESTCENGLAAAIWLENKIPSKLIVLGKSLGSIPASYVASKRSKASLILENVIILHPHKNREWLKRVEGKILAIQSLNSKVILQLPKNATLMTVIGSHFGPYWGDLYPTWYENEKDQLKLLKFLSE